MLYFMRGFLPVMYAALLPRSFRLANGLGYGVGSFFMVAGGVLVILKMVKREDDPEVELHQKVRHACMRLYRVMHAHVTLASSS